MKDEVYVAQKVKILCEEIDKFKLKPLSLPTIAGNIPLRSKHVICGNLREVLIFCFNMNKSAAKMIFFNLKITKRKI